MATITELGGETPQALLEREIERARTEVRPISRRSLANMLVKEKGIPFADATALVDSYCDEKAPYTPDFLTKEFMLPYLKLAALFFVVFSMVILGYAVKQQLAHQVSWPAFVGGAVLFLFSGLGLLRVLRIEREN
jgi:hypothetical protein